MNYPVSLTTDFRRNTFSGKYYVIEGIDGSGKSTQVERLASYFRNLGKDVVITSEPRKDEGIVGKIINEFLLAKIHIPTTSYQHLYSAERFLNHAEVVEPALQAGKVVISHRSFWSAIAYGVRDIGQSDYASASSAIFVAQGILSAYHQFFSPEKTFYLAVSPATAMERVTEMNRKTDIYEKKEILAKIVSGYTWLAHQFPDEITVIDGEKDEGEVTKAIIQNLEFRVKN